MPFTIEGPLQINQVITAQDTVQNTNIGRKVAGSDSTYGYGEFIYAKATAAIAVGQPVRIDGFNATGVLIVAGLRGIIGVAMGSVASGSYGWFQVYGLGVVKAGTVAAATMLYATATPGTVDDAVVSGDRIDGMTARTADGTPAAGFLVASLNYPAMNGNG